VEAIIFGPAALTRRRSPDHPRQERWLIFFGETSMSTPYRFTLTTPACLTVETIGQDDSAVAGSIRHRRTRRISQRSRRTESAPQLRQAEEAEHGGRFGFCNRELWVPDSTETDAPFGQTWDQTKQVPKAFLISGGLSA
jgi:hypothetical protein